MSRMKGISAEVGAVLIILMVTGAAASTWTYFNSIAEEPETANKDYLESGEVEIVSCWINDENENNIMIRNDQTKPINTEDLNFRVDETKVNPKSIEKDVVESGERSKVNLDVGINGYSNTQEIDQQVEVHLGRDSSSKFCKYEDLNMGLT